jgi:hypothetical protein
VCTVGVLLGRKRGKKMWVEGAGGQCKLRSCLYSACLTERCASLCALTHTLARMHAHLCMHTRTLTHTQILTHTQHTHTHTRTHTHIHTHAHTRTHTGSLERDTVCSQKDLAESHAAAAAQAGAELSWFQGAAGGGGRPDSPSGIIGNAVPSRSPIMVMATSTSGVWFR